ncbi:MAG TPA: phosphopantothenate/pantothenate synthetase [Candidatus Bathyarchaeia archaeon]|nr:phosphopantothenate/pantothenate synthetase [Candidatus Bathyarchaeia archaeon]
MVSKEHPRYASLALRDKLVSGYDQGIASAHGLIAHGRGEAFDYLLGEQTSENARNAAKVACAHLLTARFPVFSVNGNTATLVPDEIAELQTFIDMPIEINLFHPSRQRMEKIAEHLRAHGVTNVLTGSDFVELPNIASDRAKVDKNGIFKADVVFVPLEDGDRAQVLTTLGKIVLTVDLNPLSRTAVTSTVTIVDEVTRALKNLVSFAKDFESGYHRDELNLLKAAFDNLENLKTSYAIVLERLRSLVR